MRIDRLGPLGIIGFVAALASACDSARPVAATDGATCTTCHGGIDNQTGAPPTGLDGQATGPGVGAHTAHVVAGVECSSCHVVPDRTGLPTHPDGGRAAITFGGLAVGAAAPPPQYDPATRTCTSVYCHGATLDAGGGNTAPSWGQVLPICGSCHGYPPPSPHPNNIACSSCHSSSVEADNITFKPAHLNGTLDF